MSVSAQEAVRRAKEIAARLSGTNSASQEDETKKRRRWDEPEPHKRPKVDAKFQKRIWIAVEDRPAGHYIAFLSERLPELESDTVAVELQGRGVSASLIPGMPQQPLHVLVSGPTTADVNRATMDVEKLLLEAKEAPLQQGIDHTDQQEANQRALTTVDSSYRPASVAALISGSDLGEHAVEEQMGVPHGVVGFIIGRGGENIARMQASIGCKIQIQRETQLQPGQSMRMITLAASSQAAVDEAKRQIQAMVDERIRSMGGGYTGKDAKVQEAIAAGHVHIEVSVPEQDVGLVIGKQGATIKSIQDATGASIQVPPASEGEDGKRLVHITHPNQAGAEAAKQQIEALLQSRPSFQGPQVTIQMQIPDQDVGLCIGRQGCVIRHMQNTTGTRIQIPSAAMPGETHRLASITGTEQGCQQVQQMIARIIAEQSSASVMSGAPFEGQSSYYAQQPQQQSDAYSAEWAAYHAAQAAAQQQQAAAAPAPAPTPAAAAPAPGADAYYEQFFRYAYYYGEDAARRYYGAWSPPVGTPNPYGVNPAGIQAAPAPAAGAAAAPAAAQAPATTHTAPAPPPSAPSDGEPRETGRRKVSNLPAWMTKG